MELVNYEPKKSNKARMSNFELLRILSMILIIGHHLFVHSNFQIEYGININNIFLDFINIGGKLGVILYIMISGYFLVESKFNEKKIIKLELQVLFYSILFLIIFKIFYIPEIGKIGLKEIVKNIFPTIFCKYWFVTNYILLYIFSPFINKLIRNLSKEQYKKLIMIMLFILIFIPTITTSDLGLDNLIYFIFYYLIGAFIKLYKNENNHKKYGIYAIIFYAIIILTTILFEYLSCYKIFFKDYIGYFSKISSILLFLISYNIFMSFKNWNIKEHKLINVIASTSFGIYLIHDNCFVRKFLWLRILKLSTFYHSKLLILVSVITICILFLVCSMIELLRIKLLEPKILKITYKIYDYTKDKIIYKIKKCL